MPNGINPMSPSGVVFHIVDNERNPVGRHPPRHPLPGLQPNRFNFIAGGAQGHIEIEFVGFFVFQEERSGFGPHHPGRQFHHFFQQGRQFKGAGQGTTGFQQRLKIVGGQGPGGFRWGGIRHYAIIVNFPIL